MMKSPSILFISNLFPAEWAPHRAAFNYQQFTRLAENFDITLLVPVPAREYFKNNGRPLKKRTVKKINVIYFPFFYVPKYFKCLDGFFQYLSLRFFCKDYIRHGMYKLIVGSWAYPDGYTASKLSKKLNLPYVIKVHGSDINVFGKSRCRARVIKSVLKHAQHVIVVSNALKNIIVEMGVDGSKASLIYNGVNRDIFSSIKRDPVSEPQKKYGKYILFVGNIISTKGIFELLKAFEILAKNNRDINLLFIGNGADKKKLLELTLNNKRVSLINAMPLERIALFMSNAELICLPSYREGVPNVLLEAKASARPVVATKVGGIPEIVDKTDGILVDPQDTDSLYLGLKQAMQKHWDYAAIDNKAESFSWDKNKTEFTRILEAILCE